MWQLKKNINIYNKKNMEKSINDKEQCVQTDVMQSVLAKDLRLGNLISDIHASSSFYAEIKKITQDRVYYGSFNSHPNNLKPIQLNEEWLLKFGFEKEYGAFKLKGLKCWLTKYTSEPNLYSVNVGNIKLSTLKYVHELQNLYFALTGSELTVA